MSRQKYSNLFLIVMLALALALAGCGGNNQAATAPEDAAPLAAEAEVVVVEEAVEEPVEMAEFDLVASVDDFMTNIPAGFMTIKLDAVKELMDGGEMTLVDVRTVKEYVQTDVAAIHIEDQVAPKRCGHVAGRQVIPIEEAVGKYRAADYARKETDPDFVLIARTDARGAHGGTLDEAIRRANAYLAAGADVAFVEGPTDMDEVRRIAAEVEGPVMYNQTGISPRLSRADMEELGIAITIAPGATLRATMLTVYDLAVAMREEGPEGEKRFNEIFEAHPMGDFHTFAGFDQVMAWEREFMGEAELAKYADSVGHQPKAAE